MNQGWGYSMGRKLRRIASFGIGKGVGALVGGGVPGFIAGTIASSALDRAGSSGGSRGSGGQVSPQAGGNRFQYTYGGKPQDTSRFQITGANAEYNLLPMLHQGMNRQAIARQLSRDPVALRQFNQRFSFNSNPTLETQALRDIAAYALRSGNPAVNNEGFDQNATLAYERPSIAFQAPQVK